MFLYLLRNAPTCFGHILATFKEPNFGRDVQRVW